MKKLLAVVLALVMIMSFAACGTKENSSTVPGEKKEVELKVSTVNAVEDTINAIASVAESKADLSAIKIGMITLHDDSSTYDKNFIDSMYRALENLGMSKDQLVLYTGVGEDEACYNKAKECINQGCNVIFADSFGHEDYLIQAAGEYPDVQFCHATGTKAHTVNLDNFANAFASIYEGRYAAGIAAGMKLNEMIEAGTITADQALMGYVGAYTYAEVMSGYTSFYLGAKSVCPTVKMNVKFTGSWYDYDKEKAAAESLIGDGCVLISQHADSYGAPEACQAAKVPNVSYNGSTKDVGPDTYIVSSKINWTPYFEYMIKCVAEGKQIIKDFTGGIKSGSVELVDVNTAVAANGTQEAIDQAIADFKEGKINVFDVAKDDFITVNGEKLATYGADVDTDENFEKDTQVIFDGYFHESEYRSAPYFDVEIDGITLLDRNYG